MKLVIHTEIELEGSKNDSAYLTWLDVRAGEASRPQGSARVALLHVGEISDALGDLWPAVHRTNLESIHDLYFSQGWYRDEFADGAGIDLLYVDHVTVDDTQQSKNLDLAIVRRLCDTLGSGCQLVVMPYRNAHEAAHWARLGFTLSTPGRSSGFMHMKLGYRLARIVDATGSGDFEVLAADGPSPRSHHN